MTTKGRRRTAIAREMDLVRVVCQEPGYGHALYRERLGLTKGKFETSLRYAIEDGMVKQEGQRRGAKLFPTDKATAGEHIPNTGTVDIVALKPKWESNCSYCRIAPVVGLQVFPDGGQVNFNDPRNKAAAIRQSFHICNRCYELRLPTHAKMEQDREWMSRYPEWNSTSALREQKVFRFVKWVYSPDEMGDTSLYGRLVPLSESGDDIGAAEVHIRFTFQRSVDGIANADSISFARGYKYFHKMFGHPNSLWGQNVVASREPHKTGNGKWFWSWTPYPRIPLHIKRQLELDSVADVDTMFDDTIPEDTSLPAHQIHSIVADGDFTVIKIRKGSDEYKDKFHRLHDAILAFLAGEIGLGELEKSIMESE